MKQIIAFDLDDVLADSTEFWRVEINRRTGVYLTQEHYSVPGSYNTYYEDVWRTHGIDHLVSIPELDAHLAQDQSRISTYLGAYKALRHLASMYELVVITARYSNIKDETHKWLDENYHGIFSQILFTDGLKSLGTKNKGDFCKEIGAAWLVDDNPQHCMDALDKGVQAVLFGQYGWHYNQVPPAAVHCKDWTAVEEYFHGIS